MQTEDRVGARVAALRKVRGLTGRQLARSAHVSYSLLTKVETGHAAASPAFIGAVARALRVDVTRITGQPYEDPQSRVEQLRELVEPLRRALLTFDLPPGSDLPPQPVNELAAEVRRMSILGRRARYLQLGQELPALLDDLSLAIHDADTRSRPALYSLLPEAYGGISGIAHNLGYADLRSLTLDRIAWAAANSQDPLRVARTKWSRGASLLGAAAYDQGLLLMERTRNDLGDSVGTMSEAARSVFGSLHLRSAIISARAGRRADANDHLTQAREIAALVRQDANHYGMEFSSANVEIHHVSVAIEAENGPLALAKAGEIERDGHASSLPPVRMGHYQIEVARAWLYQGHPTHALNALKTARKIAPQQVRYHPMARDTIQTIAHTVARPTADLRSFASWMGLSY